MVISEWGSGCVVGAERCNAASGDIILNAGKKEEIDPADSTSKPKFHL